MRRRDGSPLPRREAARPGRTTLPPTLLGGRSATRVRGRSEGGIDRPLDSAAIGPSPACIEGGLWGLPGHSHGSGRSGRIRREQGAGRGSLGHLSDRPRHRPGARRSASRPSSPALRGRWPARPKCGFASGTRPPSVPRTVSANRVRDWRSMWARVARRDAPIRPRERRPARPVDPAHGPPGAPSHRARQLQGEGRPAAGLRPTTDVPPIGAAPPEPGRTPLAERD